MICLNLGNEFGPADLKDLARLTAVASGQFKDLLYKIPFKKPGGLSNG